MRPQELVNINLTRIDLTRVATSKFTNPYKVNMGVESRYETAKYKACKKT